jgi:hypothetical protein
MGELGRSKNPGEGDAGTGGSFFRTWEYEESFGQVESIRAIGLL